MNRDGMMRQIADRTQPWDIVVIGGGAVGAGVAVDASSRGFSTLLVEREDFGKGTSSRSTKLVHGGVRYLAQGNLSLVKEALRERGLLLQNAPHLVRELAFVVPSYAWWESPFYGVGMKIYDLLSQQHSLGRSRILSSAETRHRLPNLKRSGLKGGVMYYDGQFDDARLLIHLIATVVDCGGTAVNYVEAVGLKRRAALTEVTLLDREERVTFTTRAKVVVNATGIFTDITRRLMRSHAPSMVSPSQGVHLVLDRSFLDGDSAIMVPRTSDGRVMFAIPWHDRTLLGTTDTPIESADYEPVPSNEEVQFILDTAGRYLSRAPAREDILSVFTGIRPLVSLPDSRATTTSGLSREHTLHVDSDGLLTIVGGKWTTYRRMAQECVDQAIALGDLPKRACGTETMHVHGWCPPQKDKDHFDVYGSDAAAIRAIASEEPHLNERLHARLPYIGAEVAWAVRHEMARTLDDVLARRTRALILDARAAIEIAPTVGALMAGELGKSRAWVDQQIQNFTRIATLHLPSRKPHLFREPAYA